MSTVLRAMRPRQWVKNTLVFAALLFAQEYTDPQRIVLSLLAFVSFSFIASAIYIVNDIMDAEVDRLHPRKKHRPIASGELPLPLAWAAAVLLAGISLAIGLAISPLATGLLLGYAVTMVLYSFALKHIFLLDVFIIAGGLTLRAIYGAVAIDVVISHWLLICAFLISLMLALVKRRQELARTGEEIHKARRSQQTAPPVRVWDHWISMVAGITILTYLLYTVDAETVRHVGSANLLFTTPIVIYAILRYLARVQTDDAGEDPTEALTSDRGMLVAVFLWLGVTLLVLSGLLQA